MPFLERSISALHLLARSFNLPTAEVLKGNSRNSTRLHNLSRLVTQVFDFNDLVHTVTQMTSEVCDARSVWMELFSVNAETGEMSVDVVSKKNISQQEIDFIGSDDGTQLRRYLLDSQKVMLIEDIWSDRRTKYLKEKGFGARITSHHSAPFPWKNSSAFFMQRKNIKMLLTKTILM